MAKDDLLAAAKEALTAWKALGAEDARIDAVNGDYVDHETGAPIDPRNENVPFDIRLG